MRLLLDTHIWLWSVLDPSRLSPSVTRALRSSISELWLSSISLWEVTLLVEKGRIVLHRDFTTWLDEALGVAPLREAPLTHAIMRVMPSIEMPHSDPADRLLAATAATLDLQLVTAVDDEPGSDRGGCRRVGGGVDE